MYCIKRFDGKKNNHEIWFKTFCSSDYTTILIMIVQSRHYRIWLTSSLHLSMSMNVLTSLLTSKKKKSLYDFVWSIWGDLLFLLFKTFIKLIRSTFSVKINHNIKKKLNNDRRSRVFTQILHLSSKHSDKLSVNVIKLVFSWAFITIKKMKS